MSRATAGGRASAVWGASPTVCERPPSRKRIRMPACGFVGALAALLGAAAGCAGEVEAPRLRPEPPHPGLAPAQEVGLLFVDVSHWSGGWPVPTAITEFGVSAADLDDDSDVDLVVPGGRHFQVWLNRGDASFWHAADFGLRPSSSAGAGGAPVAGSSVAAVYSVVGGFIGDPALDVLALRSDTSELWEGRGDGTFSYAGQLAAPQAGVLSLTLTLGDFDYRGRLTAFLGGFIQVPADMSLEALETVIDCSAAINPAGMSVPESRFAALEGGEPAPDGSFIRERVQSTMSFDVNHDGALDLFVGTEGHELDRVYIGDGRGGFQEAGKALGFDAMTSAMGSDVGDIDGDGDPEIIVTDYLPSDGGPLWVRQADGRYANEADARGLGDLRQFSGWGVGLHDFDLDGDVDLLIVNGVPPLEGCDVGSQERTYFENDGTGHFTRRLGGAGTGLDMQSRGRGAAFADFDGDGDLDVAVSSMDAPVQILRNDFATGHWLGVDLRYPWFRPAIGAEVRVRTGDTWRSRWVAGTPSAAGSSWETVHFGLGDAQTVDEIVVRWPHGKLQRMPGGPTNRRVRVDYLP